MNDTYIPTNEDVATYRVGEWSKVRAYRIHVLIEKEEEASVSAIALNLPGLASMGDTEEEAMVNFREAAGGVLKSYLDKGVSIPWVSEADPIPDGSKQTWIIVNV